MPHADRKPLLATPEGRLAFSRHNALEAAADCRPGARLRPSEQDLRDILDLVPACRISNWGGGACHVVSEVLEVEFGWRRVGGSVLDGQGRVICPDGHLWNVLPDGAWLDATHDQFGEPRGVRVIPLDHPDHARYRYAFTTDWHPADPYFAQKHPAFADPAWPIDEDANAHAEAELGDLWWLGGQHAALADYRWRNTVHTAVSPENSPGYLAELPDDLRLATADHGLLDAAAERLAAVADLDQAIKTIPWRQPGNCFGDPALARLSRLVDASAAALTALDRALRAAADGDDVGERIAGNRLLSKALRMRMREQPYEARPAAAAFSR